MNAGSHRQPVERRDVIVIGGGPAGLLAANRVADSGHSVTLINRGGRSNLGGRASTTSHDGYRLNQGPHALYRNLQFHTALNELGIKPSGTVVATQNVFGSLSDERSPLPVGATSLLRTRLLSRSSKLKLARVMKRLTTADTTELGSLTVNDWLASITAAPDLQALLLAIIRLSTYSSAADMASADAAIQQVQASVDSGVMYVAGGWGELVEALAVRAEAAGVSFIDATVDCVRPRLANQPASVTVVDGGCYEVGAVVVAAGSPEIADKLLGTGNRLATEAGPPPTASVLELGTPAPPTVPVLLGIDRPFYLSTHSIADNIAPAGRTLTIAARYWHPGDKIGAKDVRAELEAHARLAGIDVASADMARFLYRLPVAGGLPLAARGGLAGRPSVDQPDLDGVYLAGDWVGDVGLLADASAASATKAAELAMVSVERSADSVRVRT